MFQKAMSRTFRLDRMLVMVDGKTVFISNDPLVLERDAFPIATLAERGESYKVEIELDLRGRTGREAACFRFIVRSGHDTPRGKTLTVELYEKPDEPVDERPAVRYHES